MNSAVSQPVDTRINLETAEQFSFEAQIAGPYTRAVAWSVDASIQLCVWFAGALAIVLALGAKSLGVLFAFTFFLQWFYHVGCETWMNGQTPGKRVLGLRVLQVNGLPVGVKESILRNFLRFTSVPTFFFIDLFWMAFEGRFRRIGDLAAGTMVVQESRTSPRMTAPSAGDIEAAEDRLVPSGLVLDAPVMDAIQSFCQRTRLSAAIRQELAEPLAHDICRFKSLPEPADPVRFLHIIHARSLARRAAVRSSRRGFRE